MILSADRVRQLLDNPPLKIEDRLVISPVLDPKNQLKPGSASIDIRLGQRFYVPLRAKLSRLDRLSDDHDSNLERYKDETFVPIGDHFVLHPRQLGESLEWIRLPGNLLAYVIGRSTWGRDGLVIATAIAVHPYFAGVLTLELSNIGEIPVYLYPGSSIAQLIFTSVESGAASLPPVPSVFQMQTGPNRRGSDIEDAAILKKFREKLK